MPCLEQKFKKKSKNLDSSAALCLYEVKINTSNTLVTSGFHINTAEPSIRLVHREFCWRGLQWAAVSGDVLLLRSKHQWPTDLFTIGWALVTVWHPKSGRR